MYIDNRIMNVSIHQLLKNEYLVICFRFLHLISNINHSNNIE
jgi:hypothetical protein